MEQRRSPKSPKKKTGPSPWSNKGKVRQPKPEPESLLPAIQARLNALFPDHDEQIAWMETLHPLFATAPIELLQSGREGLLLAHLDEWLREVQ